MARTKRKKFRYVEYTGIGPQMPNCNGLVEMIKNVVGTRCLTLQESNTLLAILKEVERNNKFLPVARREELKRTVLKMISDKQECLLDQEHDR